MNKYWFLSAIIATLLLVSCGKSEEEIVYDIACEAVKESLVSPSSGKFEPFDKDNRRQVVINLEAGTGNWFRESAEKSMGKEYADTAQSLKQYDDTPYSTAIVEVKYEASNRMGVMLPGGQEVMLQKWNWKDGSKSEWKVIAQYESEE